MEADRREFQDMPAVHAGIRAHFAPTHPHAAWRGLPEGIRAALRDQYLQGFEPEDVYLWGPPPILEVAKQRLAARGLRPDPSATERFG